MYSELFFEKKSQVFRVAELNFAIKQLLENSVPILWVRGEISNFVKASSGHFYFSLKDDQAQVRCVMFRQKNQFLKDPIMNGQQVEVLATATIYEQRGDFQLMIEQLRPAGLGVLYERFEQLKQLLQKEGLFATERKRFLPSYPNRVGIVTSPQAAALRDVLTTLKRRLPILPVVIYPTPVQGSGSEAKIAESINLANQHGICDVLIVCRGGGSLEDLWSFNEEIVARAISGSKIPVISGVGHETDFTIADFVADERAPTPTAAAQRVAPDRHVLMRNLQDMRKHLQRAQHNRLMNSMQAIDNLQRRLVHPAQQLRMQISQLSMMQQRFGRAYEVMVHQLLMKWQSLTQRLIHQVRYQNMQLAARVDGIGQSLALLNPDQVLERGYSITQDAQGNFVRRADQLDIGSSLRITFASGWAKTVVKELGES